MEIMPKNTPDPDNNELKDGEEIKSQLQIPLEHNHDTESQSSEDSSDEDNRNGYQLLSSAEVECHDDENFSEEDSLEKKEITPVFNESRQNDTPINEELILKTMKSITLPSIPQWANEITDSEWKDVVKKTVSKNKSTKNN